MGSSNTQFKTMFLDNLKPNFLGIPDELAIQLASSVSEELGNEITTLLSNALSEGQKDESKIRLEAFLNCSLFKIHNYRSLPNFKAYLAKSNDIEISSKYKHQLTDTFLNVRPVFYQQDMENRWAKVKATIDESNLTFIIEKLWSDLESRDQAILLDAYGIFGHKETSISDIAKRNGLTRARIYQIVNYFDTNTRRKIRLILRTASKYSEFQPTYNQPTSNSMQIFSRPEGILVLWLQSIGELCQDSRISMAIALDYISLQYPDEYLVLKKFIPSLRSTTELYQFLSVFRRPFLPISDKPEMERKIVEDENLLKRLVGVDIGALPLPIRTINILKQAGIETADQLANLNKVQMMRIPNLGRRSMNFILEYFSLYGER